MQLIVDGIDVFNPIKGKTKEITESFVSVYGEKYRDKITKNFQASHQIFVPKDEFGSLANSIDLYYYHKLHKLKDKFFETVIGNTNHNYVFQNFTLEDINNLNNLDLQDIHHTFIAKCILRHLGILGTHNGTGRGFRNQGTSFLDEVSLNPKADSDVFDALKIPENKKKFDTFVTNMYNTYVSQGYAKEQKMLETERAKMYEKAVKIDNKYNHYRDKKNAMLSSLLALKIAKLKNVPIPTLDKFQLQEMTSIYMSLFTLSENDLTKDNNLSTYAKKEFVELFNFCGFSGKSYEDIVSHPKFKTTFLSQKLKNEVDKIIYKQDSLKALSFEPFAHAMDIVRQTKPKSGTLNYAQLTYHFMNGMDKICGCIGVYEDKETHEAGALLLCPWAIEGQDSTIIHELGHIAGIKLIKTPMGNYIKCGLDTSQLDDNSPDYNGTNLFPIVQQPTEHPKRRKHEIFAEVIHEYFSLEVTKNLHEKGIALTLEEQKDTSDSAYTLCFPILTNFIKENREALIDATMSDDANALAKHLGQENLDVIAKATSDYFNCMRDAAERNNFYQEINRAMDETDKHTVAEVVATDYNWTPKTSEIIEMIKTVYTVRNNIKTRLKTQSLEQSEKPI